MAYKQELWEEAKKKCHFLSKIFQIKRKCGKLLLRTGFTICMKKGTKKQNGEQRGNNKIKATTTTSKPVV